MSHSFSSWRARNCRNPLTQARGNREALAERHWRELRRHATIEKDPETLLRLTAEIDKRKRQTDAAGRRNGN